jgi:hypothetical protein
MASSNKNNFVMGLSTIMILCCWSVTNAWITTVQNSHRLSLAKTAMPSLSRESKHSRVVRHLYDDDQYMDSAESAKPLSLSVADLQRFTEMKSRTLTIPILIMDAIVPGQRLSFQRYDPRRKSSQTTFTGFSRF